MYLNRLAISYRILEAADASGMQAINIFVGPNNAGKTSLFKALMGVGDFFAQIGSGKLLDESPWKEFKNATGERATVCLEIPLASFRIGSKSDFAVGFSFEKATIECFIRHIPSGHKESSRPLVLGQIGTWGSQSSHSDAMDSLGHYLFADLFAIMTTHSQSERHKAHQR